MHDERAGDEGRIASLRQKVKQAFPPEKYDGTVTSYDPGPWTEELDEEQAPYETLTGRSWTEVSPRFLQNNPDAYLLLTPQAYAAFVAAWLNHSLENLGGENEVREFLIYTCSPPANSWQILSPLNPQQRATVRSLIAEFVERESNSFVREKAIKALARVDELLQAGKYIPYRG